MTWLHTPFHHGARVKGAGVDCAQFIAAVFNEAGIISDFIVISPYPADWMMHRDEPRFEQELAKYASRVPLKEEEPGDIVTFKWGRSVSHGAIVVKWPQVIHSYIGRGVVLGDLSTEVDLRRRYSGLWSPWNA